MVQLNEFIRIKDESLVYKHGKYLLPDNIDTGEYYLWGEKLWFKYKVGETEYFGGGKETYHTFVNGEIFYLLMGEMTPIDNIEYIKNSSDLLLPDHIYIVSEKKYQLENTYFLMRKIAAAIGAFYTAKKMNVKSKNVIIWKVLVLQFLVVDMVLQLLRQI